MDENILLIDDDCAFREIATLVLREHGYTVYAADCPARAFPVLAKERVDLVLCDLHMPFITGEFEDEYLFSYETGVRTIQEIHYALPHVPVVGVSATAQVDLDKISGQVFPSPVVSKPTECNELVRIVEIFLDASRARNEETLHIV